MGNSPKVEVKPYDGPAGGWGSVKAVGSILTQEEVLLLGSEIRPRLPVHLRDRGHDLSGSAMSWSKSR